MSPRAHRMLRITAVILGALLAISKLIAELRAAEPRPAKSPGLTRAQAEAEAEAKRLADEAIRAIRADPKRAAEVKDGRIELDGLTMRFATRTFGERPATGRSLFLSLHGGGNAPSRVNDQQYENQKRLYQPAEGVYVAPRAPTNTWDLWHQEHIDRFFARLIADMVAFEEVDPDRVYLMGYSAGGDGVYQVAPRMADRFAAASMMAGHPNETKPLGLRNLPFAIHVGANDAGFDRNKVAQTFGAELDRLHEADPKGYVHHVELHPGKGHWMDREDASAVPWMAQYRRETAPKKVVWLQDDVTHDQFYWLAVPPGTARAGAIVEAAVVGQEVQITRAEGLGDALLVRLNDRLLDLDQPVKITVRGEVRFEGRVARSAATLAKTLAERDDPGLMFPAEVLIRLDHPADPPR